MAAPNIVGVSTIVGITTFLKLANTSANLLVSNPPNSDYVYKINSISVSNTSAVGPAEITIKIHDAAAGAGTSFSLTTNVSIATKSSLVVLDKSATIYLEENRSLTAQANNSNYLDVVCSYEAIIDT